MVFNKLLKERMKVKILNAFSCIISKPSLVIYEQSLRNGFCQPFLIKINKINIFIISKIEEMNAPLNRAYQSLHRKSSLLSFRHINKTTVSWVRQ